MNLWESLDSEPAFKAFLVSRAWNAEKWNASEPWQRAQEQNEFQFGKPLNDSVIAQIPGAVADTVGGFKNKIVTAAAATGKTVAKAAISTLVGLGLTALIAYRKPISELLKKAGK